MKTLLQIIFWSIATPVLFIVAVAVIWIIYLIWQHERNPLYNNNASEFAPVINPHPQYFMTIHGFIDPKLPWRLKLQILTTYTTNTNECAYVENIMVGEIPRYRNITLTAKSDKQGNYMLKIPLDYYVVDRCNWRIQNMEFLPTHTGLSPILISFFTSNASLVPGFKTNEITKLSCDSNFNCDNNGYGQYSISALPINHNYNYQINIYYKRSQP